MNDTTNTTGLRERITREADAHDYFAANPDLRMTTSDHAKRAENLRAIAALSPPALDAPVVSVADGDQVLALLAEGGYIQPAWRLQQARRIVSRLGHADEPEQAADPDHYTMVPGDADDMAEALVEIATTLGCANTVDDILHAIDAYASPVAAQAVTDEMIQRGAKAIAPPVMLGENTFRSVAEAVLTAALAHPNAAPCDAQGAE